MRLIYIIKYLETLLYHGKVMMGLVRNTDLKVDPENQSNASFIILNWKTNILRSPALVLTISRH
jgi:hypothetical protein